jgi:hypothetical protein
MTPGCPRTTTAAVVAHHLLCAHTYSMIELGAGHAYSTAAPADFFARWIDHEGWSEWSPDSEWVTFKGPVQLGAKGVLKPKGAPRVKFTISALENDRRYADTSVFPGARLVFDHTAAEAGGRTELRARVTVAGPLAGLWAKILSKGFRHSVQADLDRLVTLVEAQR